MTGSSVVSIFEISLDITWETEIYLAPECIGPVVTHVSASLYRELKQKSSLDIYDMEHLRIIPMYVIRYN